jgi:hypothetical protein
MPEERAARGKTAYIKELEELYSRCLASMGEIAEFSRTAEERYPRRVTGNASARKSQVRLEPLAISTISQILSNQVRKKLPRWPWVACFVVSCNGLAFENDVTDVDPGRDALSYWVRRHILAESAERHGGVTLPTGPRTFLANHGPFGKTLIEEVGAGVSSAFYPAAVILASSRDHRDEALALVFWRLASEHPATSSLATDAPDALEPGNIARHARLLAEKAKSPDEAAAFHQAADRASEDSARDRHRTPPRSGGRSAGATGRPRHRNPSSGGSSAVDGGTSG